MKCYPRGSNKLFNLSLIQYGVLPVLVAAKKAMTNLSNCNLTLSLSCFEKVAYCTKISNITVVSSGKTLPANL
jgi:hypothetical protein